jgi:hypothetical protein
LQRVCRANFHARRVQFQLASCQRR